MARSWYLEFGKRPFDLVGATLLAVIMWPVMLVVAVLVWTTLGRPVVFVQQRPGRHGRPFDLVKFRTMSQQRDARGRLLPDGERLGRIGRVLRSLSLDELPELLNVIRGDMSMVGPRPLLMAYLPRYTPEQARRHEVRPGLTGWAQVNGRNALTWNERFRLDVWYVDHVTLWLDLKILARTVTQVTRREGISQVGHATAPEFTGTKPNGTP